MKTPWKFHGSTMVARKAPQKNHGRILNPTGRYGHHGSTMEFHWRHDGIPMHVPWKPHHGSPMDVPMEACTVLVWKSHEFSRGKRGFHGSRIEAHGKTIKVSLEALCFHGSLMEDPPWKHHGNPYGNTMFPWKNYGSPHESYSSASMEVPCKSHRNTIEFRMEAWKRQETPWKHPKVPM